MALTLMSEHGVYRRADSVVLGCFACAQCAPTLIYRCAGPPCRLVTSSHPPAEYLRTAPVSFPLIGLTQLANYAVLLHVLGLGGIPRAPAHLLECIAGATGH